MPALAGTPPFDVVRFTGSHATDWVDVEFDRWVRKVGIDNQGTEPIYVGARQTGAWGSSDAYVQVPAGSLMDFYPGSLQTLSIYGGDGAAHAMAFVLEGA